MTRTMRTVTLATLIALLATAAVAQPGLAPRAGRGGWNDDDGPGGWRLDRLTERLELTDQQREAIDALHEKARADAVELRKEIARLRLRIDGEMLADEPSESTLVDLTEQLGALRTRMQVQRLKTRLAVRDQLTAEQRDELMLMRGHGRRGRGGPGWHRGGCRGCAPGADDAWQPRGPRGRGQGQGQGARRGL
jgi:Spy/CpxP family protein refolding chaperone